MDHPTDLIRSGNCFEDIDSLNPLSLSDENLADILISKYEYLDSCISNENFDASLCSNLVLLLKFILENGIHLDEDVNHREQMDMFFTLFRNILRNHLRYLPYSINLLILRLIEIRASKWKIKPSIEEYYMKKVENKISPNNFRSIEKQSTGIRLSKSFGDVLNNNLNNNNFSDDCFRNSKILKTNSKGVLKDEVLIKNSDSGKVMGIKGRRVHMIEEMSDTIISFQKVSPNVKDRVVQITGYNRENIEKAKNLIDVTIKQNISPIPFETDACYNNDPIENIFLLQPNEQTEHVKIKNNLTNINYNILSEDDNSYLLSLNFKNKEIQIKTSDRLVGRKLEYFLNKNKFLDFLLNFDDVNVKDANDNEPSCDLRKSKIIYDRDFLFSFKDLIKETNPRLINDIKQKQQHLLRE